MLIALVEAWCGFGHVGVQFSYTYVVNSAGGLCAAQATKPLLFSEGGGNSEEECYVTLEIAGGEFGEVGWLVCG